MQAATDLTTDCLSVYRLTKLVTHDKITKPIRNKVVQAAYVNAGRAQQIAHECGQRPDDVDWSEIAMGDEDAPNLATLVTCRWCAGVWIAGAATVARIVFPRGWRFASRALALSAAAGLFAALEDG